MDENRKRQIERRVHIAGIGVLALVMAYLLYCGFAKRELGSMYPVVIGGGILIFWLIEDVLKPMLTREFDGMTEKQLSNYRKCSALSFVGYAGLVYFAVSLNRQSGFYGAVVYVICLMVKRRLQSEEAEAEEDAEAEEPLEIAEAEEPLKIAGAEEPSEIAEEAAVAETAGISGTAGIAGKSGSALADEAAAAEETVETAVTGEASGAAGSAETDRP